MTRSSAQIRSHAQKFLVKLSKKYRNKYSSESNIKDIEKEEDEKEGNFLIFRFS